MKTMADEHLKISRLLLLGVFERAVKCAIDEVYGSQTGTEKWTVVVGENDFITAGPEAFEYEVRFQIFRIKDGKADTEPCEPRDDLTSECEYCVALYCWDGQAGSSKSGEVTFEFHYGNDALIEKLATQLRKLTAAGRI